MTTKLARAVLGSILTACTAQHYRLLEILAVGGSATVFIAGHLESGQKVALKLWHRLDPAPANQRSAYLHKRLQQRQQFNREIGICQQFQHPHLVCLLDQSHPDAEHCFAVFPLISGHTLKDWLIKQGNFSVQHSREIMLQVLQTLLVLHKHGVAHGDLKPQNIMLDGLDGSRNLHVTLLDFGNAQLLAAPQRANAFCSPAYSPPEQVRGAPPDTRCDLYAWGLLFLECLSGQAAVSGHNVAELCQQQLSDSVVPIPPGLAEHPLVALLTRVLNKDWRWRESNAGAVLRDLLALDLRDLAEQFQVQGRGGGGQGGASEQTQACEPRAL